jgi:hypothetical protein
MFMFMGGELNVPRRTVFSARRRQFVAPIGVLAYNPEFAQAAG